MGELPAGRCEASSDASLGPERAGYFLRALGSKTRQVSSAQQISSVSCGREWSLHLTILEVDLGR